MENQLQCETALFFSDMNYGHAAIPALQRQQPDNEMLN